jgi:hypothetical protein
MKENNKGINWKICIKYKEIVIKRNRTKLDTKIKWNKMLRDKIKKKIKSIKRKNKYQSKNKDKN